MCPPEDERRWPTLGPGVCAFIQRWLVHGPGDLRGEPAKLDEEKQGLIHRLYEVYPRDHPQAGRRRFKRGALSLRKGSAKTEFAAWIAACELHPDAPVRCVGWTWNEETEEWEPVGGGVRDPYIPMVAYTKEQSDELAYSALLAVIEEGPLRGDFDTGLTRILRRDGTGRAVALSNAPNARDGARTTFQVFDETHRLVLPNQKDAHQTMLGNIPKRYLADAWSLEVTTAYSPGEQSVAEDTMDYARMIASGQIKDPLLFFFHRQAGDAHDKLETSEQIMAALLEASGPVAEWSDLHAIVGQWQNPKADKTFLERVWLNRPLKSSARAFDVEDWASCARVGYRPAKGAAITLGFDGARVRDSTALVGCEIATGFLFVLGLWEKPPEAKSRDESEDGWEVPADELQSAVEAAFAEFRVLRMYCDPPWWESTVDGWAGRWGKEVVYFWWTNRDRATAFAIRAFWDAVRVGELSHDGSPDFQRHIGNAVRRDIRMRDENGLQYFCIQKERADSVFKIDLAMAGILAWEARGDAIKAGALAEEEPSFEIFFVGGGSPSRNQGGR